MALEANGKKAWSAYAVPLPLAAVFQPENEYPVRANALAGSARGVVEDTAAMAPVPPLGLNVTVGAAAHCA